MWKLVHIGIGATFGLLACALVSSLPVYALIWGGDPGIVAPFIIVAVLVGGGIGWWVANWWASFTVISVVTAALCGSLGGVVVGAVFWVVFYWQIY